MRDFFVSSVFFSVLICVLTYEFGIFLKKKTGLALCNPLLISIALVILILSAFRVPYERFYSGAAYLSDLLTPATVCLALPLYEKVHLLKHNWKAIMAGICGGVFCGLLSILGFSLLFGLPRELYISLLPKSITTAIGLSISSELGGIPTISASLIIITGVFGNVIAESALKLFRIRDPIARGIAIGTSSHAAGTAKAMEMGETEGAMSSLAIVLAGIITVAAASVFAGLR